MQSFRYFSLRPKLPRFFVNSSFPPFRTPIFVLDTLVQREGNEQDTVREPARRTCRKYEKADSPKEKANQIILENVKVGIIQTRSDGGRTKCPRIAYTPEIRRRTRIPLHLIGQNRRRARERRGHTPVPLE